MTPAEPSLKKLAKATKLWLKSLFLKGSQAWEPKMAKKGMCERVCVRYDIQT